MIGEPQHREGIAGQSVLENPLPIQGDSLRQLNDSRLVRSPKKIWIDLDNSPHVPFFVPIIEELQKRGYEVVLTARDSYQVCQLLKFHHLSCKVLGGHWGKNHGLKMIGTCLRALRLLPVALLERPDLGVSHGSRAQLITGFLSRIPMVTIYDYEHVAKMGFIRPDWLFSPQYIPESSNPRERKREMKYPGLKEDVYAPRLRPDPSVMSELGLNGTDLVVTVRPPATEAHYHNPEAETLLDAAMRLFIQRDDVRVILLPRNQRQAETLRKSWEQWIATGKIIIPKNVVDGVNLIWLSDLVVSGGGTMNREAAALGVPVYSIFRGLIGAVDRYLAAHGQLVLLESVEDVRTKIILRRKKPAYREAPKHSPALDHIVDGIVSIVEHHRLPELG